MISRVLLSLAAGLAVEGAVMWAFGPPQSFTAVLCLIGIAGCFGLIGFVLPRQEEDAQ